MKEVSEMTNQEIKEQYQIHGTYEKTAKALNCSKSLIARALEGLRHVSKTTRKKKTCTYKGCNRNVKKGNYFLCSIHEKLSHDEDDWN